MTRWWINVRKRKACQFYSLHRSLAACRNGERDAVVQSTRTHCTHTLALSPLPPSSLPFSLSLSLVLVPSRQQQPARCEKWIRWARGDGATPPLSSFAPARLAAASQGPPLIIQSREWCNAHHIGRISPSPSPVYTHMHIHTESGEGAMCRNNEAVL